jgi:cytochrome b6-f complex iron-sulfur subunit
VIPPLRHRLLLWAYPREWRHRYGAEFCELLARRHLGLADVLDVVAGGIDVRRHPTGEQRRPLERLAAMPVPAPARSPSAFGIVAAAPPDGVLSRRTFMRRVLGVGVGLLSLEFLAGTASFLWPNIRQGLGAEFRLGRLEDILAAQPSFAEGKPYPFNPARIFLVNVPAATAWATGNPVSVAEPTQDELLALWRKCPHLGCLVPQPCESVARYQCRCHQSTYNILGEKMAKGPAERGLDRFAVRIERDGTVVVNTAELTRGAPNLGPANLAFDDGHPWEATCGG